MFSLCDWLVITDQERLIVTFDQSDIPTQEELHAFANLLSVVNDKEEVSSIKPSIGSVSLGKTISDVKIKPMMGNVDILFEPVSFI